MTIKDRRSNIIHGRYSRALVLPAAIEKGKESTLAANRLIIVDPRGEISEADLLEFMEEQIEPNFWPWLKQKRERMSPEKYSKSITRTNTEEVSEE